MIDEAEGYYFIVAFVSMMFLSGWWATITAMVVVAVCFGLYSVTQVDREKRTSWKW